ncbi:hypothetical protein KL953_29400 [Mycolicibacterium goodii]|nr:hypothetical protein [Mycolicibacterium goodii]
MNALWWWDGVQWTGAVNEAAAATSVPPAPR